MTRAYFHSPRRSVIKERSLFCFEDHQDALERYISEREEYSCVKETWLRDRSYIQIYRMEIYQICRLQITDSHLFPSSHF